MASWNPRGSRARRACTSASSSPQYALWNHGKKAARSLDCTRHSCQLRPVTSSGCGHFGWLPLAHFAYHFTQAALHLTGNTSSHHEAIRGSLRLPDMLWNPGMQIPLLPPALLAHFGQNCPEPPASLNTRWGSRIPVLEGPRRSMRRHLRRSYPKHPLLVEKSPTSSRVTLHALRHWVCRPHLVMG